MLVIWEVVYPGKFEFISQTIILTVITFNVSDILRKEKVLNSNQGFSIHNCDILRTPLSCLSTPTLG